MVIGKKEHILNIIGFAISLIMFFLYAGLRLHYGDPLDYSNLQKGFVALTAMMIASPFSAMLINRLNATTKRTEKHSTINRRIYVYTSFVWAIVLGVGVASLIIKGA